MGQLTDITRYPVIAKRCKSCPFREGGDLKTRERVMVRCMTEASQICHHPSLFGEKETHLCRGARDYQKQIFHRMGLLKDETDEAWEELRNQLKKNK